MPDTNREELERKNNMKPENTPENKAKFFAVQWKDVKGTNGMYQVSNNGVVRRGSTIAGLLKPNLDISTGYYTVKIPINGMRKTKKVHSLVAECFLGEKPQGRIVIDHIDNDPLNNDVSNLQYVTHRENLSKNRISNTGITGVYKTKGNNYRAMIEVQNKRIHLGLFATLEQAKLAYQNKLKSL